MALVWEHSKQEGSRLLVLLAVATHCDESGAWRGDLRTLQRQARLDRRWLQRVLHELGEAGELVFEPGRGRGNASLFRLTVAKGGVQTTFCEEKVAPTPPFEPEKVVCTPPFKSPLAEKAVCTPPFEEKGGLHATLSEPEKVASTPPFSPPFPPTPPLSTHNSPLRSSSVDSEPEVQPQPQPPVRPLSGPQQAVAKINDLLREAGVPLPSPGQVAGWIKALGGVDPLAELVAELIEGGLVVKKHPDRYIHAVVMTRSDAAGRGNGLRRGSPHAAGADGRRREQARRLFEEAGE